MQVLVTGARGFVGRTVTMALLGDGHNVRGLVRDQASAETLRRAGVSLHAGDMRSPPSTSWPARWRRRARTSTRGWSAPGVASTGAITARS